MNRGRRAGISPVVTVFAAVVVAVAAGGAYLAITSGGLNGATSSSTTGGSAIQGVVTGYVTVGPAQPVCQANQSCNVNVTGYSLVFVATCAGPAHSCSPVLAALSPSGHYSILLPPGEYSVTGLSPSCSWVGCPAAFPKTVTVAAGMQVVVDFSIDTGIR